MKIFKEQLERDFTGKLQFLHIADNSRILCSQEQHNQINVWFESKGDLMRRFYFRIFGTGIEIPSENENGKLELEYLNTVQIHGFVYHIYKQLNQSGKYGNQ